MKILITGGNGFLGKSLQTKIKQHDVVTFSSQEYNLIDAQQTDDLFSKTRPDIVVHLAATVGGIGANKENPGKFIYENLAMGINTIETSRKYEVKKFAMVGTVCSYPKFTPVPFVEEDLWNGYPEETNAPYGIAKKALMQMVMSYKEQYGFNGINLIPVNMYGPHDNFNPRSSHVIPALILKFHQAMKDSTHSPVEIWGTGSASREFLYVDDCAEAIWRAIDVHENPNPINIGTGKEISIKDLAHKIADLMNYRGAIYFNSDYPDGQPRRCLDISKASKALSFEAQTALDDGLQKTITWFKGSNDIINNI